MAKKLLVISIVLPVVAIGAYFGGEYLLAKSAQTVLARIESSLPPGSTFTHGTLSTNLLKREVALQNVVVKVPDATGGKSLSAASMRFNGLPWVTKGAFELGELVVDGLRIERNGIITAEHWVIEQPGVNVVSHLAAGDQAYGDFVFASAEATNLTVSRIAPKVDVTVANIKAGALASNRLSRLEINDVKAASQDVTGPLVKMTVAQVAADDIDLTRILAEDGNIDLTAPLLTNGLSGLIVNALSLGPENGEPITLDSLTVKGEGLADGTRTALSIKADNMVMPLAAMPLEARQYYGELGYQKMVMNFDMSGRYDPTAHTLSIAPFNFTALDAGSINLQLAMGGLANISSMSKDPANAQMVAASMTLNALEIKLTDAGYVKRQVDHGAKAMAVTSDVYVEQLINAIKPPATAAGLGAQKLGQLYRAVSSFLLNPGELTISARPEKPVAFLQLLFSANNPAAAAETLNISAANRQLEQTTPNP